MTDEAGDDVRYTVVINHEEQYSIWPEGDRELPAGWTAVGKSGSREECLDHIEEVWTDMRPKGVPTPPVAWGTYGSPCTISLGTPLSPALVLPSGAHLRLI